MRYLQILDYGEFHVYCQYPHFPLEPLKGTDVYRYTAVQFGPSIPALYASATLSRICLPSLTCLSAVLFCLMQ